MKKIKKLGILRSAHCSLYLLSSQERDREKLISLSLSFFFLLQPIPLFSLFTATQVPQDPGVPHLGINPEKIKNLKDMGTLQSRPNKVQQSSLGSKLNVEITDEWKQRMGHIYTMQHFSMIKKQEIMPSPAPGNKVEMIILIEVRETERDKYHVILPLSVI